MKPVSLRSRLVIGLVAVVGLGLAITGGTTYLVVRSFLYDRLDDQLRSASVSVVGRIGRQEPDQPAPSGDGPDKRPPSYVPPGTYGEVRNADGTSSNLVFAFEDDYSPPLLPETINIPAGGESFFNVGSEGGSLNYRVLATWTPDQRLLLTALPLSGVEQTLSDLRLSAALVGGGVVLLVAVIAYWLARLSLRPLDSFAAAAAQIAEGNLGRRVEHTDDRTEVGRLGQSFNTMVASLEEAFSEQRAAQERLRRFVADASHELRTPLTSIRGYAELFERGASERPEDRTRVIRRISEESERMSVLVDDLLLLARLDHGRPLARTNVDLSGLARDAVDDARVRAPGREIALSADAAVMVEGDEGALRQVLTNLVSNALQHTPTDAGVAVSVANSGPMAVIEVADRGPGVEPAQASKVFEPFFRLDKGRIRSKGGAGLGLSIVKAIVEEHGGEVSVRPNDPHGAIFRVTLPLAESTQVA